MGAYHTKYLGFVTLFNTARKSCVRRYSRDNWLIFNFTLHSSEPITLSRHLTQIINVSQQDLSIVWENRKTTVFEVSVCLRIKILGSCTTYVTYEGKAQRLHSPLHIRWISARHCILGSTSSVIFSEETRENFTRINWPLRWIETNSDVGARNQATASSEFNMTPKCIIHISVQERWGRKSCNTLI